MTTEATDAIFALRDANGEWIATEFNGDVERVPGLMVFRSYGAACAWVWANARDAEIVELRVGEAMPRTDLPSAWDHDGVPADAQPVEA